MSAHTNGYRSPVSRKVRDRDDASSVAGSEISGSNEHPHVDASDSPVQSSASQEENGATSEEESNSEEGADKTPSASADSSVESSESSHCSNGRNGRSMSYDSRRTLKRKANIDDDEHIANNPELYGLRRSVRDLISERELTVADYM
jgi:chromodomain-helicase-DNA-binding protein 1